MSFTAFVDLATGKTERLYDTVDGRRLAGLNDIVHAKADGSAITRVVDHFFPNGVGLSPDGKTLYAALSFDRL